jgi:hypothetical protein
MVTASTPREAAAEVEQLERLMHDTYERACA